MRDNDRVQSRLWGRVTPKTVFIVGSGLLSTDLARTTTLPVYCPAGAFLLFNRDETAYDSITWSAECQWLETETIWPWFIDT